MATLLETLAADGTLLLRTPLVIGVTLVQAQPDLVYRVVKNFGGKMSHAALVKRVDADLRIELPQDRNISLEGFFTHCTPEASCSLSMENIGDAADETTTPGDGVGGPTARGRPVDVCVGRRDGARRGRYGIGVLVQAGRRAGRRAGDRGGRRWRVRQQLDAPTAPELTGGALTRLARPVFTGAAESGARVTLTLFGSRPVTYETTAGTGGT